MTILLSRRALIASLGATTFFVPGRSGAQSVDDILRNLTWDEARREAVWRNRSGPLFQFIYGRPFVHGSDLYKPAPSLDYGMLRETGEIMRRISGFYRDRNLPAPLLPVGPDIMGGQGDRFYMVFVEDMPGSDTRSARNGANGAGFQPNFGPSPVSPNAFAVFWGQGIEGLRQNYADAFNDGRIERPVAQGNHIVINHRQYAASVARPATAWEFQRTLSHELRHAIDDVAPWGGLHPDVLGKWWKEGCNDGASLDALRPIGVNPLGVLRPGTRERVYNAGLRPYDTPLTLKGTPNAVAPWVTNGAQRPMNIVLEFYAYMTCSFWRYLLKEMAPVPAAGSGPAQAADGDFELLAPLSRLEITEEDRSKGLANPDMDAGVSALDRFVREHHPTWRDQGLYRAFPAFIAHFVEWPDTVLESRRGELAHPTWIESMFPDSHAVSDISIGQEIVRDFYIEPLAARPIRFVLPEVLDTPGLGKPRLTVTVTAHDAVDGSPMIDNIHLGVRGHCQANGMDNGETRHWADVDAQPLNPDTVNGESILTLINVAPDPVRTRRVQVRVVVAVSMGEISGSATFRPKPRTDDNGRLVTPPASNRPVPRKRTPALPITRQRDGLIETALPHDDDLARFLGASPLSGVNLTFEAMAANRPTTTPPRDNMALLLESTTRLASGNMQSGIQFGLKIPYAPEGFSGRTRGVASLAWFDRAYMAYHHIGLGPQVDMETDAVEVNVISSTKGSIVGTFRADFAAGSQNTDGEYSGVIEGRFSVGVIADEAEGAAPPADRAMSVGTDFFVMASKASMDIRPLLAELRADRADDDEPAAPARGGSGSGGSAPQTCTITDADIRAFARETLAHVPDSGPIIEQMVREMSTLPRELLEQSLCAWTTGAG